MLLIITAIDFHEMTRETVEQLKESVDPDGFKLLIYDNVSDDPYTVEEFNESPFPIEVYRPLKNRGYYYSLLPIFLTHLDEYIGLCHNDLYIYEKGWNKRMESCFKNDPKLGLIGLVGSNEVDGAGGRGGGTMCFFRGEKGQSQSAGDRITDLRPSLVLDSLFMMFNREAILNLEINEKITLGHFYDKIWPLKLVFSGWRVATLGVECDHLGGVSTMANLRWYNDCKEWLEENNVPYTNPETEMYLESERRLISEFGDKIPLRISSSYELLR